MTARKHSWITAQRQFALTIFGHLLSSEDRAAHTMQTPVIQTAFAGAGIGQLVAEQNAAILVREDFGQGNGSNWVAKSLYVLLEVSLSH